MPKSQPEDRTHARTDRTRKNTTDAKSNQGEEQPTSGATLRHAVGERGGAQRECCCGCHHNGAADVADQCLLSLLPSSQPTLRLQLAPLQPDHQCCTAIAAGSQPFLPQPIPRLRKRCFPTGFWWSGSLTTSNQPITQPPKTMFFPMVFGGLAP